MVVGPDHGNASSSSEPKAIHDTTSLTPRATGWIASTSSPAARFSRTGRKILDSKSAANDASCSDTGSSGDPRTWPFRCIGRQVYKQANLRFYRRHLHPVRATLQRVACEGRDAAPKRSTRETRKIDFVRFLVRFHGEPSSTEKPRGVCLILPWYFVDALSARSRPWCGKPRAYTSSQVGVGRGVQSRRIVYGRRGQGAVKELGREEGTNS